MRAVCFSQFHFRASAFDGFATPFGYGSREVDFFGGPLPRRQHVYAGAGNEATGLVQRRRQYCADTCLHICGSRGAFGEFGLRIAADECKSRAHLLQRVGTH